MKLILISAIFATVAIATVLAAGLSPNAANAAAEPTVYDEVSMKLSVANAFKQLKKDQSGSRGVGKVMVPKCNANDELDGALCYNKCKDGFEAIGCCLCRKSGIPGRGAGPANQGGLSGQSPVFDENGMKESIGLGFTKIKNDNNNGQGKGVGTDSVPLCLTAAGDPVDPTATDNEANLCIPKCKAGYKQSGCCLCVPA